MRSGPFRTPRQAGQSPRCLREGSSSFGLVAYRRRRLTSAGTAAVTSAEEPIPGDSQVVSGSSYGVVWLDRFLRRFCSTSSRVSSRSRSDADAPQRHGAALQRDQLAAPQLVSHTHRAWPGLLGSFAGDPRGWWLATLRFFGHLQRSSGCLRVSTSTSRRLFQTTTG